MDTDFEKFTWEEFLVDCDFDSNMTTGESITLATSSVTIFDSDGVDVTATMLITDSEAVSGTKLQANIQGGTIDAKYTVKFKAVTDANINNKFQEDKTLYIKYETS